MKCKKWLFILFLFSLLALSACTSGAAKNEEFPPTMTGVVLINNQEYDMKPSGYRWTKKSGNDTQIVTTDAASPNQIAEELTAIPMKEGSNITIEVEDNPELSVYQWNENRRINNIPLSDNKFSPPSTKGRYIYEVIANWSNGHVRGEVSYTFVIEVK
ncbi:hypothetical protein [Paenisporosarcina quisquiliarum]|uniref:hypothetical protein n=1 Tax=Paenisporosarcina quisquiliarum TaxID=365346 RepID=UPI0037367E97